MSNQARTPAQRRIAEANNYSTGIKDGNGNPDPYNSFSRKSGSNRRHHSSGGHGDDAVSSVSNTGKRNHDHNGGDGDLCAVTAQSSLLQPRMAVVLGLSKIWHPLLFVCRLLSIGPAVWWGLPSGLRLLVMLHLLLFSDKSSLRVSTAGSGTGTASLASAGHSDVSSFEARLRLLEALLATVWVSFVPPPSPTTPSGTDLD